MRQETGYRSKIHLSIPSICAIDVLGVHSFDLFVGDLVVEDESSTLGPILYWSFLEQVH